MKGNVLKTGIRQIIAAILCPAMLPSYSHLKMIAGMRDKDAAPRRNRGHGGKHAAMCKKCDGRQMRNHSKYHPFIEDAKHRGEK